MVLVDAAIAWRDRKIADWAEEAREEGIEKGLEEGLEKGRAERLAPKRNRDWRDLAYAGLRRRGRAASPSTSPRPTSPRPSTTITPSFSP